MTYTVAAKRALKGYEHAQRVINDYRINKKDQFRSLTVYESTGTAKSIKSALFGIQFCDENGSNYREMLIYVNETEIDIREITSLDK